MKFLGKLSITMLTISLASVSFAQYIEPNPWSSQRYIEHIDKGTSAITGKRMHVCDRGVMSGIHVNNNDLLCVEFYYPTNPVNPTMYSPSIDINTTIDPFGTRVCPPGYAMVGVHVKDNFIKCTQVYYSGRDSLVEQFMNPWAGRTIRHGMHSCPAGTYMAGWQKPPHHNLICRTTGLPVNPFF